MQYYDLQLVNIFRSAVATLMSDHLHLFLQHNI